MKKSTAGFLMILLIGVSGIAAWKWLAPRLFVRGQEKTSDAGKGALMRIGGDNYLGYWFINSPEMRKQAARKGIRIAFADDGGAYTERLEKFAKGEYDCIVLPVSSYLEHGAPHQFPGVIVAAVSESKGADGIVGFADRLPTGKINDLNDPNLSITYTAGSPSSFLLDLTVADFDLSHLANGGGNRLPSDSSKAVLNAAKKGEGDVFILWEPDLSQALKLPGMKYIWGSDRFSGYILDVFVFNRTFIEEHRERAETFLETYFRVLDLYANNRDKMIGEMAQQLPKDTVQQMVQKIEWFDLQENKSFQFGMTANPQERAVEGIVNSIIACTDVLLRSGNLDKDPLDGDPYLITNSSLMEALEGSRLRSLGGDGTADFEPLNEAQWQLLREIGTFRMAAITFQSWNNQLTDEGKDQVDKIAGLLKNNYPGYRILIRGHTGPGGDEQENKHLSQARADVVRQYMTAVHDIDPNRLLAQGVGSSMPPPKKPGESPRTYRYRLSRVVFIALEGNRL